MAVAIANAEEEVMARRCDGYMSSDDDLPVRASVLVVDDATTDEETIAKRSATITRWCVDSGANRDICNERQLFKGEMKAKTIRIGEAGQGHSFMSQGEGYTATSARQGTATVRAHYLCRTGK